MSVTQDYKILTLTKAELQAIDHALTDRAVELQQLLLDEYDPTIARCLENAKSARAKVRA